MLKHNFSCHEEDPNIFRVESHLKYLYLELCTVLRTMKNLFELEL